MSNLVFPAKQVNQETRPILIIIILFLFLTQSLDLESV